MFLSRRAICTLTVFMSLLVMACGQSLTTGPAEQGLQPPTVEVDDEETSRTSITINVGNPNGVQIIALCFYKRGGADISWNPLKNKSVIVSSHGTSSLEFDGLDDNTLYSFRCRRNVGTTFNSETVTATTGAKGDG